MNAILAFMFSAYKKQKHTVNGVNIHCRVGGSGPGLLLLHGHPQTHVIWHKVADQLVTEFTVVAADLRGYGDSDKPALSVDSVAYSKRVMAQDQLELMNLLGFQSFCVLAHDRGARVAHRLALDHPEAVKSMTLLDIAPTLTMYEQTNQEFARAYWHWFFLIQPPPLPESLIEADPENYLRSVMGARSAGMGPFTEEAFNEYLRCLKLPGAAVGMCEDYLAAAGIDLQHDAEDIESGNMIACPLQVLWGSEGIINQCFDPLEEWQKVTGDVTGEELPSGHYIPEEIPQLLLEATLPFLNKYGKS